MNEIATLLETPALETAPPLARPASAQLAAMSPPLCERIVVGLLRRMQAGCLHLVLPGGRTHTFGQPGAEITARIRVLRSTFFQKCIFFGDVGFGESYVDGDWETDSLERVISWFILNGAEVPGLSGSGRRSVLVNWFGLVNRLRHLARPNSLQTSRRNIEEHYDLGNDFYGLWLDESMTYSSGIFSHPGQSLASAQAAKYERLCQQLRLRPEDHVLEIGCGWGGFSAYAAREYGCRVTAITISPSQQAYAQARMVREGVADRVKVQLQDYRHVTGQFDKIVSIEMMEALGDAYLPDFCRQLHRLLAPRGIVALQFITVPDAHHAALRRGVDWIQKHIFPGSLLLSLGRVNERMARAGGFHLHDLKDLGLSYARTLHLWWERFNAAEREVRALGFSQRFLRKWNYYLQYCEAAFARRQISVLQAVYTRPNNPSLHEH